MRFFSEGITIRRTARVRKTGNLLSTPPSPRREVSVLELRRLISGATAEEVKQKNARTKPMLIDLTENIKGLGTKIAIRRAQNEANFFGSGASPRSSLQHSWLPEGTCYASSFAGMIKVEGNGHVETAADCFSASDRGMKMRKDGVAHICGLFRGNGMERKRRKPSDVESEQVYGG